jgi:hypothetical protein
LPVADSVSYSITHPFAEPDAPAFLVVQDIPVVAVVSESLGC